MRIDRRGFMFGAAALAGSQCLAAGRTLAHKPKAVVIFYADDLG